MKLFSAIAAAAVIGGSYLIPIPALATNCSAMKIENQIEDQRSANELARLRAANQTLLSEQASRDSSAGTPAVLRADNQIIQQGFNKLAESELDAEQQKAKLKRDSEFKIQCM